MPRAHKVSVESDSSEKRRRLRPRSSRLSEAINYPRPIFFLIGNEFCERLAYYGILTILSTYIKTMLDFSEAKGPVVYHAFIMFSFFFPLVGGIMADSWLGSYRTILYMSTVYVTGGSFVTISAIPGFPPTTFTMIGLTMIIIGSGCVKPCAVSFGADQFVLPQQENYLRKFFPIWYFTINAGSFIGSTLTQELRDQHCLKRNTCYSLGFGIPTIMLFLSIVILVAGKRFYRLRKPDRYVIFRACRCIWYAISKRKKRAKRVEHWLDRAADRFDPSFINDIKNVFRILVLFIPLPFFWLLFDQQESRWMYQATRMNGDIGPVKLTAEQMSVVNPILILLLVPLFEAFVYPAFAKYNLLKKPLQRMTVGGLLAALAFGVSALVEYKLEDTYPVQPKPKEAQLRLYNACQERLDITFLSPSYEEITIESKDMWKKYDIPADGEERMQFKYTVKGEEKTNSLSVFENSLTSYIITQSGLRQIATDETDKSVDGFAKLMIIYVETTEPTMVAVTQCGYYQEFMVTAATPYSQYQEFPDCDSYKVSVEGRVVLEDVKLKQGGVYSIIVLDNGDAQLVTVIPPNSLNMLWLMPQYVIITAAEIVFSITGLEFSYTQAPVSMKAFLQACWLLTIAFGNVLVTIVAEWKIFERQLYELLLFAGLMTLDMFIFAILAMRYTYVTVPAPPSAYETPVQRKARDPAARSRDPAARSRDPDESRAKRGREAKDPDEKSKDTGEKSKDTGEKSKDTGERSREPEDRRGRRHRRPRESAERSREPDERSREPEDRRGKRNRRARDPDDRSREPEDRRGKRSRRARDHDDRSRDIGERSREPEDRRGKRSRRARDHDDRSRDIGERSREPDERSREPEDRRGRRHRKFRESLGRRS